ncbi:MULTISPECIES: tRNA threonylcarbamoyladenosine dehydratase [unclassified Variovorax]|uniref:tRNA threonylcarbamoyladenosine dehydratase n=1 Tax=unclassified Variovorax TaxID=663243 RepID=UPI000F7ED117|nr:MULTISPECIES: tRNA threonylcarbamoyladenosine dehydratase [unclassified Variovorax]RSZ37104.1 tRNA threonylcarbamoyladenosine dehydratase [Variovorax sp. 553]RSZ37917.1 tRNA threonylcarbamoyladenosine dehydratase [Variovorax sp. 679]
MSAIITAAFTPPAAADVVTDTAAPDFARRFGGLERLYGVAGAARIRNAHVLVVGIGGVGSWAVEALARSGVGRLTMIDLDHVSESNINRQIHALDATVGQAKVEAMRDRIAQINPECKVQAIDDFVEPGNWLSLLEAAQAANGPATAVIDACDQVKAKVAMAAWARASRNAFVTVGAAGGKRQAHKVDIEDLSLVTHDPLLAQLRQRLRKEHGAPREGRKIGVACVFSRESVAPPDASCAIESGDGSLNCHGYGSVVSVTATFGQCAAGWVLDKIASNLAL